tara:strand:- start:65398 stop:66138 length:741 start_codon:yes stop_codon:yes gene_type:complete
MSDEIKFSGIERLYGKDALLHFQSQRFTVIGLGGVGSWAAEALVRSGIKKLTLVDYDEICISNFNRQVHALDKHIGASKIKTLQERFTNIHANIEVNLIEDFYSQDNSDSILQQSDIIIDAIDSLSAKCLLINECRKYEKKLVVSGGAGGKKDPCKLNVGDLSKTINDPLLQKLRKKLRRDYNFPRGDKKFHIPCVYSEELPQLPNACERPQGQLDCETGFGTASFLTGSMGFFLAQQALEISLRS